MPSTNAMPMKPIALHNPLPFRLIGKLIQAKRRLLNWRGDGVHSPYAYRVIRETIRNPHPFSAFTHLYNATQAQTLRHKYKDRYCTHRKHLELIFRFVHNHRPESIYFAEGSESLIHSYLKATGYYNESSEITLAQLIIIEDICPKIEELLSRKDNKRDFYMILNTHNPEVRVWINRHRTQLCPPIIFDTLPLQMWVWRTATTPGHYPVYY